VADRAGAAGVGRDSARGAKPTPPTRMLWQVFDTRLRADPDAQPEPEPAPTEAS